MRFSMHSISLSGLLTLLPQRCDALDQLRKYRSRAARVVPTHSGGIWLVIVQVRQNFDWRQYKTAQSQRYSSL
jgi:hypothetical protein